MWNPTFFPFQTCSPKWAWFSTNVFELLKLFVQCYLWFEIILKFEFSLGLSWSLSIQLVSSLGLLFSPVSAIKTSMADISEKQWWLSPGCCCVCILYVKCCWSLVLLSAWFIGLFSRWILSLHKHCMLTFYLWKSLNFLVWDDTILYCQHFFLVLYPDI